MVNACRLRTESDAKTAEPIYKRNPYTNVDILVGKLIGKETVCYGNTFTYKEHRTDWSVRFYDNKLSITNNKSGSELFGKGMFTVYDWEKRTTKELNEKTLLLSPQESLLLSCKLESNQVISIKVDSGKEILLLPKFAI